MKVVLRGEIMNICIDLILLLSIKKQHISVKMAFRIKKINVHYICVLHK
jgi:hypothetical protein